MALIGVVPLNDGVHDRVATPLSSVAVPNTLPDPYENPTVPVTLAGLTLAVRFTGSPGNAVLGEAFIVVVVGVNGSTCRIRFDPSAISRPYMGEFHATPLTPPNQVSVGATLSGPAPLVPFPANVEMMPLMSTLRIRKLPRSVKY